MNENVPSSNNESSAPREDDSSIANHLKAKSIWMRLFFMFVVGLLYSISRVVVGAVVVIQFFWVLFTGASNEKLLQLGRSLSTYTYQIVLYLTFNTEERPFPFDAEWPTN